MKGYKARDSVSHRGTKLSTLYSRFKQGKTTFRGKGMAKGSGHEAGRNWGAAKGIDPNSQVKKYSKNSPSFDEGVWEYKAAQKKQYLAEQMR